MGSWWADAEVVATGANNPAVCRLWAAPLQYCCSSTRYLLQLERPHSRHWIGNWDNQLHLLLRVRCVACGLETTQWPLSRCTVTQRTWRSSLVVVRWPSGAS